MGPLTFNCHVSEQWQQWQQHLSLEELLPAPAAFIEVKMELGTWWAF